MVVSEEVNEYDIVQYDLSGAERTWAQHFDFNFTYADGEMAFPVYMDDVHYIQPKSAKNPPPQFIQLNSTGLGYGTFSYGLDYVKGEFLFEKAKVDIPSIEDSLRRGAAYIMLHEYLLYEGMNPQLYLSFIEEYVNSENEKLILSYLLDNLEWIFWKFLKPELWAENAPVVEELLWRKMRATSDVEMKHILFKKYISMSYSETAVTQMLNLWNGELVIDGLELSESESILLAYHIALKSKDDLTEILDMQIDKITNPDTKAKMSFVSKALAWDVVERDAFFDSLLQVDNRANENWVVTALYYLHHPVRTATSIRYLKRALEILPELQKTGDIFFPKRWLDNTLRGYSSSESIEIINQYLKANPELNPQLKSKLLQSADMVFRAGRDISYYYSLQE